MGQGIQGAILRALGAQEHILYVTGSEYITENYLRVHFHSPTLLAADEQSPGSLIRLWMPNPDKPEQLFQRGYTIINERAVTGEFDIDFVIHYPVGPGCYWAMNTSAGEELRATRHGSEQFSMPAEEPAGYLFAGDTTAYPAICAITEYIRERQPLVPIYIYMEEHRESDRELPLPTGENITARWVPEIPDGQALIQAISPHSWEGYYAWLCAESRATQHLRTHFSRVYGLKKGTMHAQAYWVRGKAMGKSQTLNQINEEHISNIRQVDEPTQILAPARGTLRKARYAQILISMLNILPYLMVAELARYMIEGALAEHYIALGILALSCMLLGGLGHMALSYYMHSYEAHFSAELRRALMTKLTRLPLGWFSTCGSQDIKKLLSEDVRSLHYRITHAEMEAVDAIATPLIILIYVGYIFPPMIIIVLIPIVLMLRIMLCTLKRDSQHIMESQRREVQLATHTQHLAQARTPARIFGVDSVSNTIPLAQESGEFLSAWQLKTGPSKIVGVMLNKPMTMLGLIAISSYLFILLGWMAPVQMVPLLIVGTSCGARLLAISHGLSALGASNMARDNIELFLGMPEMNLMETSVLEKNQESEKKPYPAETTHRGVSLDFREVSFSYPGSLPVLTTMTLRCEPGTRTALVGPSGSGKSTIVMLAARLWDVDSGQVLIDGKDIRSFSRAELYSMISYMGQDTQIISGTVRENIALARPESTLEEIIGAAQAACIHEVIENMPQGYETIINQNRLSGGERQRIGIARALLADTQLIILDEMTASADPNTQQEIQRAIEPLLESKTVLMVAHRLESVEHADQILMVEAGNIAERGTHHTLMKHSGSYAALWEHSAHGGANAH